MRLVYRVNATVQRAIRNLSKLVLSEAVLQNLIGGMFMSVFLAPELSLIF